MIEKPTLSDVMDWLLGTLLWVAGFVLVGVYSSWWVSLGIFFLLWANNLDQSDE